jgi:hypothetical protein
MQRAERRQVTQPPLDTACTAQLTQPIPCSSAAPSMRCSNCSHTFCFTHGDSHPGKSCSQWARDNLQSEKETEKAIKSFTKMCPGCHVATQKSAGCNHMKCTQCKTEWCAAFHSASVSPLMHIPLPGVGYARLQLFQAARTPLIMPNGTFLDAPVHSSAAANLSLPAAYALSCCLSCCLPSCLLLD